MRPTSRRAALVPLLALAAALRAGAQPAEIPNAAELELRLAKLKVMGSALYVAAHPDDENTALLAYWSKGRLVETAYLSMTRGDGGQNLIGTEKGELMGLLRTQELLAARRVDGARQFFTRAIDFGYSKGPEETLSIWGKDAVLADTVWAIRNLRPDVVVTRFPTTGEGGHGQHTASAILAVEAFSAAGDPSRFPEQLKWVAPWQPKRLLWNAFRFGADAPRNTKPGWLSVDLGAYNALLGKSYTEIAALSRSMHKSQGFGSAERRGTWLNDFAPIAGDPAQSDLFDGVDLTWGRVKGGAAVTKALDEATRAFDPKDPAAVVAPLVKAYAAMASLRNEPLVARKMEETLELIRDAAGLWIEAIAAQPEVTPGGELKVTAMALNRSKVPLTLVGLEVADQAAPVAAAGALKENEPAKTEVVLKVPATAPISNPYWLQAPPGKGLYAVEDPRLVGLPESPAPFTARFVLAFLGEKLAFETPVFWRTTDPVKGELYRRVEVVPPVTASLDEKTYDVPVNGKGVPPRDVRVTLRAARAGVSGALRLKLPAGWKAAPESAPFALKEKGDETALRFTLTAPSAPSVASLEAVAEVDGAPVSRSVVTIDYPHVPLQVLFPPAEARLVRVDLAMTKKEIGYVMGSGDEVPDALRQLGARVTLLADDDLETLDLTRFSAIVAGVRAYNTRPRLKLLKPRLMSYVEKGGTYLVQYDTTSELVTNDIGPYPFHISRDRVTVEEAKVDMTPGSPLLASPNRIGDADFDGWVQERGLYFADTWDPKYETPLACHDPGEPEKKGGLLYGRYGKGVFIYTGYAFFRQLPAGVPGALRLFANLVSAS
jgi:LmbE family N-acetylglucosaminyl deacetylase